MALTLLLPVGSARGQDSEPIQEPPAGSETSAEAAPATPPTAARLKAEAKAAALAKSKAEAREKALAEAAAQTEARATAREAAQAKPATTKPAGGPAPKKPRGGKLTPAEEFSELLHEAILLEVKAQNYERKTLGAQDLERLGGILLKRRQRIDDDLTGFEERLSGVSMDPLTMPVAPEDAELSTKELLALSSLGIAYEASRDLRPLQSFMASNQSFLSTIDWGDRDRAVRLRDNIVQREASLLNLAGQARDILRGGKRPVEVERMIVTLRHLTPEALSEKSNVNSLILRDDDMRQQVVAEAMEFLQTPSRSMVPEEDSSTLVDRLTSLQIALVDASHLSELREELTVIDVEIRDLDVRLADRGVNSLSPIEREEKSARWSELNNRQSILQHQWMRTPPAQPQLDELVRAQDDVIRRSMFELGYRGALFAHRYDLQREETEASLAMPYTTWELIEEQASLIREMDEARPDPGPLDGLPPRLDPSYVKAQKDLILALRKTRPDMFGRLPPVTKAKSIKVRTGKAQGTTPLGAVGASSKKKNKSGGGGRGRGRRR